MAEFFVLNTGARIPSIGLGTAKTEPGTVGEAVYAAVKVCLLMESVEIALFFYLDKLFESAVAVAVKICSIQI